MGAYVRNIVLWVYNLALDHGTCDFCKAKSHWIEVIGQRCSRNMQVAEGLTLGQQWHGLYMFTFFASEAAKNLLLSRLFVLNRSPRNNHRKLLKSLQFERALLKNMYLELTQENRNREANLAHRGARGWDLQAFSHSWDQAQTWL